MENMIAGGISNVFTATPFYDNGSQERMRGGAGAAWICSMSQKT